MPPFRLATNDMLDCFKVGRQSNTIKQNDGAVLKEGSFGLQI